MADAALPAPTPRPRGLIWLLALAVFLFFATWGAALAPWAFEIPRAWEAPFAEWLSRFRTAMLALPERQRQASLLPLLHNYQRPEIPLRGSLAPTDRFRAAVQDAKIGADKDIPHVTRDIIVKYVTDLELLGLSDR